jgi:hypothetical protein
MAIPQASGPLYSSAALHGVYSVWRNYLQLLAIPCTSGKHYLELSETIWLMKFRAKLRGNYRPFN